MFSFSLILRTYGELADGTGFAQTTLEHRSNKSKAGAIKQMIPC